MNTKIRNFFTAISIVLLAAIVIVQNPARAEAKVQDGKYYFSPCTVTKFQIKNGTLVLKVDKDRMGGITKDNDKNQKTYKLKVKVAKNCKYRFMEYNRGTGESSSGKTNYKKIKEAISVNRSFYKETGSASNVADSCIEVKGNKVVKITYVAM